MKEGIGDGTRGQALFEALIAEQRGARIALEALVKCLSRLAPKQIRKGRREPGRERIAIDLMSRVGPNIPEISRQMGVSERTLYRMEAFMERYQILRGMERGRRPTGDREE